jgi:hypothetical protein
LDVRHNVARFWHGDCRAEYIRGANRLVDLFDLEVDAVILVCPKCSLQMRCKQVGVAAEAMAVFGSYQLFMADVYECPSCHAEVLGGFPQLPVKRNFEPDYLDSVARYGQKRLVQYWANEREKAQCEREMLPPLAGGRK